MKGSLISIVDLDTAALWAAVSHLTAVMALTELDLNDSYFMHLYECYRPLMAEIDRRLKRDYIGDVKK